MKFLAKSRTFLTLFLILSFLLPGCLFSGCIGERNPPTEEEIELLIQDLVSPDARLSDEARERLIEAGSPAVEPLLRALEDENMNLRFEVLYVLSAIGDERAVDPLILIVEDKDEDLEFRARALEALGLIAASSGSERALDTFIRVIYDEEEEMYLKITALETLGIITGGGPYTVTTDPAVDDKAVEILIRSLQAENETVSWMAAMSLGGGGEAALEPLIQVLKSDESEDMRAEAARSLGMIGGDRGFEALVTALETDESEFVRWNAAYSLGSEYNGFNERAVEPLGKALKYDESAEVRKAAAEGLANSGSDKAVDLLTETLENESEDLEVRKAAIFSLNIINYNFGSEKAVDALRRNRDCENETLRQIIEDRLHEIETGEIQVIEVIEEPMEEVEEPMGKVEEPMGEVEESMEIEGTSEPIELKEETA